MRWFPETRSMGDVERGLVLAFEMLVERLTALECAVAGIQRTLTAAEEVRGPPPEPDPGAYPMTVNGAAFGLDATRIWRVNQGFRRNRFVKVAWEADDESGGMLRPMVALEAYLEGSAPEGGAADELALTLERWSVDRGHLHAMWHAFARHAGDQPVPSDKADLALAWVQTATLDDCGIEAPQGFTQASNVMAYVYTRMAATLVGKAPARTSQGGRSGPKVLAMNCGDLLLEADSLEETLTALTAIADGLMGRRGGLARDEVTVKFLSHPEETLWQTRFLEGDDAARAVWAGLHPNVQHRLKSTTNTGFWRT